MRVAPALQNCNSLKIIQQLALQIKRVEIRQQLHGGDGTNPHIDRRAHLHMRISVLDHARHKGRRRRNIRNAQLALRKIQIGQDPRAKIRGCRVRAIAIGVVQQNQPLLQSRNAFQFLEHLFAARRINHRSGAGRAWQRKIHAGNRIRKIAAQSKRAVQLVGELVLLNEVRHKRFQKAIQTITYIPHFISITVLVAMLFTFCNQSTGIINLLLGKFFHMQPVPLMQSERWFLFMFILSGIWQDMGYGSILYIATLSTVDPCLHEAAIIDGAHRGQRIWHINLPCLTPTIVIMLIMRMGSVINVGFEKVFLMQNSLNMNVSEVLSTYVYRLGLINSRYDFSTAVNLFTSVVNCTMLVAVNAISRKVSDHSLW